MRLSLNGNQEADGREARKEDAVEFGPVGHKEEESIVNSATLSCGFTESGRTEMETLKVKGRSWFVVENHKYSLKLMNELICLIINLFIIDLTHYVFPH